MMSHSQQVQLAVGTQNCFSTQFYTPYTNIKTSAQNAPKCIIARQKIKKKFLGRGHGALPTRGEYSLPRPHPPFGARRLSVLVPFHLRLEHWSECSRFRTCLSFWPYTPVIKNSWYLKRFKSHCTDKHTLLKTCQLRCIIAVPAVNVSTVWQYCTVTGAHLASGAYPKDEQ